MHLPNNDSTLSSMQTPPQLFKPFSIDKPVIGLTGGIGSGKTAVSDWFADKGIKVVDADVVSHQIMKAGSPTLLKLVDALGDWVVDSDGNMNRAAVRSHVFDNDKSLLILESITHPAIRQEIIEQLTQATSTYVILSAPLLLESVEAGLVSLCDRVLVVDVPESVQLQRASQRDTQSRDKIAAIMDNQLSRQERNEFADDIVTNDGSLEDLYNQLIPLHEQYMSMQKPI